MFYLFGLLIALPIFIFNVFNIKKSTIPFIVLFQLISISTSLLFGLYSLAYAIPFLVIVLFLKHRQIKFEVPLDYTGTLFSISLIINKLRPRKSNLVYCGSIIPVNKKQIKNNGRLISMSEVLLSGATLITGSIGSGKTSTMTSIIKQRIAMKKPVVFFDYKGETGILDDLESFCKEASVPFYEFSSRRCTFSYDPLLHLNSTGRVEALMNTRRWDASGADEHYRTSTQLVIQSVVAAYDEFREKNNDISNYTIGLRKFTNSYLPSSNEKDGFATLCKQLDILISSLASEMFSENKEKFSFEEDGVFVICFSFISANKALANFLSSFIFQDIMDRGTRRKYDPGLLLCLDEFGTLESSTLIKDILEKGRSGGCQTVFSILDINQISMSAGEHFAHAILGTINSFIIHAGATQKTAEVLAGVQKYENQGYSIMDLRKPYKGKPPTALFISKYPIISTKGNQEMYKIYPYIFGGNIKATERYKNKASILFEPSEDSYINEVEYLEPLEELIEEQEYINEDSDESIEYSIDDLDDLF